MAARVAMKRKRLEVDVEDQLFHLENLSNNLSYAFEPVQKLLRAHLPLSWLAPTTAQSTVAGGSVLSGHITETGWEYSVLIARQIPNGGLAVFEKIDKDYYILQPLQPFVNEKLVRDASVGAVQPVSLQTILHYLPQPSTRPGCHSRTPSVSTDINSKIPKNRKGAAARLSILTSKEEADAIHPLSADALNSHLDSIPNEPPDHEKTTVALDHLVLDSTEQADNIIEDTTLSNSAIQVQDTSQDQIYANVEPSVPDAPVDHLAPSYLRRRYLEFLYMTKEPLSFYCKGPLSRARARARAENASMTSAELAQFYRASILPAKRLDLKYKSSLREAIVNTQEPKSSRRTKLGRDGLWPCELDVIRKWPRSSKDPNHAISDLRMREAQMQMLLMMEILAIESKLESAGQTKLDSNPPDSKPSKRRDIDADLKDLADRLCIWHAVGLEGQLTENPEKNERDLLREFCINVLLVFYNSKLPLVCKALCKTLAGPQLYDSIQKEARLKEKPLIPGSTIQRSNSQRSATLERVASDRFASPVHFKRETSEVSIRPLSRQASVTFGGREVDLEADAQITASKRRKMDMVANHRTELTSAIDALKKPNREAASRQFRNEVEQRTSRLTKPILVNATPRVNRKKNMVDLPQSSYPIKHALGSAKKKAVLTAFSDSADQIPVTPSKDDIVAYMPSLPVTFDLPNIATKTMDRAMAMPPSDNIYETLGWNDDDDDDHLE